MSSDSGIKIPFEQLAPDVLSSVIEEFVTRDGTNLVDAEAKIAQVRRAIERGQVEVWFDPESQSCNLLPRDGSGLDG